MVGYFHVVQFKEVAKLSIRMIEYVGDELSLPFDSTLDLASLQK